MGSTFAGTDSMANSPKIVVVTPVKNEAWILDRFLSVTSEFADHIVIADQGSSDNSPVICQRFPKVTLIKNESKWYSEASRQLLLLQVARELVQDQKLILALDADEILAANAMSTLGWRTMLEAPPGTVLCFDKPDLLSPEQCIRYDSPWPLGYMDDGADHMPKEVHSIRIPVPDIAPRLVVHDVKILHYALTRPSAQASKMRMYSVIENVLQTNPLRRRRAGYRANKNWSRGQRIDSTRGEWFEHWERLDIDMNSILTERYYWQDLEVLRYFEQFGERKFWFEDIWDFDWEACRRFAHSSGIAKVPTTTIVPPPLFIKWEMKVFDQLNFVLRRLRGFL